jgi:hypothetical protein
LRIENLDELAHCLTVFDWRKPVGLFGGASHLAIARAAANRGPVWAAQLFLISLLVPFYLNVGDLLLMPHRIIIIGLFFPFFLMLFVMGKAGRVLAADWLLFLTALWAGLGLAVNHDVGTAIQPFGIFMIEFFGAYLIARVAIRSAADFQRMVGTFFVILLILFPFAAMEAVTKRPILLDFLPGNNVGVIWAGERLGLRRVQAVFAHPILFGVFVSTGLGLFWYALQPRWLRFPAVLITGVLTVFSLSTGALISFFVQGIFIGWEAILKTLRRRWSIFAGLFVLGYIVVDLVSVRTPFHVLVNYASFSSGSAYNRIRIWTYGTENVWQNPVFGLGLNDWVRPSWMGASVDNYWLLIAMLYGLPAIVMVLAALTQILKRVAYSQSPDPRVALCRAGYLVVFGGLFVAGGTVHYWHAMMAFVMFIYGSGVWLATLEPEDDQDPDFKSQADIPAKGRSKYTRQPGLNQPIGASARRPVRALKEPPAARRQPLRRARQAPRP